MRPKSIRAIIVEDEPAGMENLRWLLQKYCPEVKIIAACESGEDAIKTIKRYFPDVVFLDIHLGDMNGFDVLESIKKLVFEVIFTTAKDQYMLQAIRKQAIDYLMKPIKRSELQEAVQKVQMKLLSQNELPSKVGLPVATGERFVSASNILYLEANNFKSRATVKTPNSEIATIELVRGLGKMAQQLQNYHFCRVHNSYLINLDHLIEYIRNDGGYVVMSNGKPFPVAKGRRDEFLQSIANWRNGK